MDTGIVAALLGVGGSFMMGFLAGAFWMVRAITSVTTELKIFVKSQVEVNQEFGKEIRDLQQTKHTHPVGGGSNGGNYELDSVTRDTEAVGHAGGEADATRQGP